eukprot:TRINITY_DN4895_c0_g1_i1.p1 TRINITY_DN4895_c0_g1~~TRINITY_DN4895_c0_g1_i1.p1  ORF type:complete len:777 (-),score=256.75 TRINITY_DN4895_c0_g1_i1:315-2645(-)
MLAKRRSSYNHIASKATNNTTNNETKSSENNSENGKNPPQPRSTIPTATITSERRITIRKNAIKKLAESKKVDSKFEPKLESKESKVEVENSLSKRESSVNSKLNGKSGKKEVQQLPKKEENHTKMGSPWNNTDSSPETSNSRPSPTIQVSSSKTHPRNLKTSHNEENMEASPFTRNLEAKLAQQKLINASKREKTPIKSSSTASPSDFIGTSPQKREQEMQERIQKNINELMHGDLMGIPLSPEPKKASISKNSVFTYSLPTNSPRHQIPPPQLPVSNKLGSKVFSPSKTSQQQQNKTNFQPPQLPISQTHMESKIAAAITRQDNSSPPNTSLRTSPIFKNTFNSNPSTQESISPPKVPHSSSTARNIPKDNQSSPIKLSPNKVSPSKLPSTDKSPKKKRYMSPSKRLKAERKLVNETNDSIGDDVKIMKRTFSGTSTTAGASLNTSTSKKFLAMTRSKSKSSNNVFTSEINPPILPPTGTLFPNSSSLKVNKSNNDSSPSKYIDPRVNRQQSDHPQIPKATTQSEAISPPLIPNPIGKDLQRKRSSPIIPRSLLVNQESSLLASTTPPKQKFSPSKNDSNSRIADSDETLMNLEDRIEKLILKNGGRVKKNFNNSQNKESPEISNNNTTPVTTDHNNARKGENELSDFEKELERRLKETEKQQKTKPLPPKNNNGRKPRNKKATVPVPFTFRSTSRSRNSEARNKSNTSEQYATSNNSHHHIPNKHTTEVRQKFNSSGTNTTTSTATTVGVSKPRRKVTVAQSPQFSKFSWQKK